MAPTPARRIRFDHYTVDLRARELYRDESRVPLQEKPFRLLVRLVERAGDIVTRDELCDSLWPATHVDRQAGLNTAVRKLRAALGEATTAHPRLLETVPRVGYRLRVVPREVPQGRVTDLLQHGVATRAVLGQAAAWVLVALAVSTVLGPMQSSGATSPPMPKQPGLRDLYAESRSLLGSGRDLVRARELLRTLVAEEPSFSAGYAHLAEASARVAFRSADPSDIAAARRAAERARRVAPRSAVTQRAAAMISLLFDWDIEAAGERLARAVELAPNDPVNQLALATHRSILGSHEHAIAAARRAVELDPESMPIRSDTGYFLLRAGRFEEAVDECEMLLRLEPENTFGHSCLVTAHAFASDPEASRRHALTLLDRAGATTAALSRIQAAADPRSEYVSWSLPRLLAEPAGATVEIAAQHLALGDAESALLWLDRAATERAPELVFVPEDFRFVELHGNARYERILKRAGLPERLVAG